MQAKQATLPGTEVPRRARPRVSPEARSLTRAARDLCPREGGLVKSITLTVPRTGASVTLTADTRKKINRLLRD